ncbi:MAG: hypothetical protein M3R55_10760 [Acidobacteriota bacterium]|nr:hypothetical protein [Acidobacteriota bacterium]
MTPRDRTVDAFEAVRRLASIGSTCEVIAHGALGAAFGSILAWSGGAGTLLMGALTLAGALISAAWAAGRLPAVAAGRMIERRYPECRNVLVTAEELLAGTLEADAPSTDRVFQRAADMLTRIDAHRASGAARRVAVSVAVTSACAAVIVALWRS